MKNLENENLKNRRKTKEHSLFLDIVVTIISILSSMNGLMSIMSGWFDPLSEMEPLLHIGGISMTIVDIIGGILGLAIGLAIGLLFKTLSESLGLTQSDKKRELIVGSLLMLGTVDTLLIAYGQYAGYVKLEQHKAQLMSREKNQVKEEAYNSARENVSLVKAQIESLQKELLSKEGVNAAATAEQSKAMLLSREIKAINEKYDLKKREYKPTDYKNLNWIEVLREKEIKKTKERIKLISPIEASMQYKEKLEQKIEALIEKKKHYLQELEKASQEIKRDDAKLTDWWIVALGAFLSALGFTYFSYRINRLKGDAKAEYETGLKTVKTRFENAKMRENGNSSEEQMSPLMQRMQEMKAR